MKAGIVTALIALCLPVTVFATSLRLSNDIDLLVLDGKKSLQLITAWRRQYRAGKWSPPARISRRKNHSLVQPRRTSVYFASAGHQL